MDDKLFWQYVIAVLLCFIVVTPFIGLYFYKQEIIQNFYQQSDMSPRIETPFSGEIVPAIGTGWNRYNTYTISLYNVDNKTMRIVEPPDFGGFLPIRGKETTFEVSGENWMMQFYHANPCVPTHIFVYNETHYEHAVINQTCLCM